MSANLILAVTAGVLVASGVYLLLERSLTRILLKPSHIIGGYAQLTWAFNYLGPTGNQRDEITSIRRRNQEVEY